MTTYLALLRGINVSGKNLIRMEALKSCLETNGLFNVSTYIQSGNILFTYAENSAEELENSIQRSILNDFGFKVPVIVMTANKLDGIILENPFIFERNLAIDTLHLTYLSGEPSAESIHAILPLNDGIDEGILIGNRIYLNCPNGYGSTRFNNSFFEKKLHLHSTTRNWKTIIKLQALIAENYS